MGLAESLFHQTVSADSTVFIETIKSVIEDVLNVSPTAEVYVFGSVARQQATNNSDLDILINVSENENYKDVRKRFYEIKKRYPFKVDIVFVQNKVFQKKDSSLLQEIENEMIQVYPVWNFI